MITVMTQNAANYDDHPGWIDRLPFLCNTVIGNNVDVLCLSEVRYSPNNAFNSYAAAFWQNQGMTPPPSGEPNMADHVVNFLNARQSTNPVWTSYVTPVATYSGGSWEGLAIISRLPMTNQGSFSMSSGHGDGNPRATQYATVTTAEGGTPILLNTHFALDETDRNSDAQEIVSNVAGASMCLVVGDLNATPDDPAVALLQNQGALTDLWGKANPGDQGYTFSSPVPVKRIDYMMAQAGLASAFQSIAIVPAPVNTDDGRCEGGTVYMSDHFGLVATFAI